GDDDEQREPVGAVGHARGDEADRLDRDDARDVELEHSRVLAALGVDVEVAAALDDARVDREPDAVGRLELEAEVERAEVAAVGRERETGDHADAVDGGLQGTEIRRERSRELDGNARTAAVVGDRDPQVERDDLDRAELDVGRYRDLDATAAF